MRSHLLVKLGERQLQPCQHSCHRKRSVEKGVESIETVFKLFLSGVGCFEDTFKTVRLRYDVKLRRWFDRLNEPPEDTVQRYNDFLGRVNLGGKYKISLEAQIEEQLYFDIDISRTILHVSARQSSSILGNNNITLSQF